MWRSKLVAIGMLAACHPAGSPSTRTADARANAARVRIAIAEAKRAGGLDELLAIVARGAISERVLALRALGRIGGTRATDALIAACADREPRVASMAAGGLGVAAALEELPAARTSDVTRTLVRLLSRLNVDRAEIAEAIGRAADPSAQSAMLPLLADRELAAVAAVALGRFGRRKLPLADAARAALIDASTSPAVDVRADATWALAREFIAPSRAAAATVAATATAATTATISALLSRVADSDPSVRAAAIDGLARHSALASSASASAVRAALISALADPDSHVAVEAVRALAGDHGDDAGRDAVAASISRRLAALTAKPPAAVVAASVPVILEALRVLDSASSAARPDVQAMLAGARAPEAVEALAPLTRGWIQCLAAAAQVRAAPAPSSDAVTNCSSELPEPQRRQLVADLITDDVGPYAQRLADATALAADHVPRIRAAGIGALAALWSASAADARAAIVRVVVAELANPDPAIAGAASGTADAIEAFARAAPAADAATVAPLLAQLDAAIIARATIEPEPELAASLLELVGKFKMDDRTATPFGAAGTTACRASLAGHAVRARAAAKCLRDLGAADAPLAAAEVEPVVAAPPPAPVAAALAAVIGHRVRWHVETTRGAIEIQLAPEVAPWTVATIVSLTRRGFYDGLELHRVVANFVVQGGDPTMSGAGGPGFTIPAEPSTHADGAGFITGGAGIADAGPDSGGSQWFVMHSRAPHLDGRYTWFGAVTAGQDVVDALEIGDAVTHATITIDE
jgi:peptidyl-prolyl cis-trans isomerase B (cyclophilin B)